MGFRDPILTAVDPVARQSANDAATDAARALTQIIPGTRLAADAIDGKTITGVTISGATVIGSLLRANGSGDVTATSTGHALQAGPTAGNNIVVDGNEIMARLNGAVANLYLHQARSLDGPQDTAGNAYAQVSWVNGKFTDTGWQTITTSAGFTVQATPQVRNVNGVLFFRGGWTNAGMAASSSYNVGALPAGFPRPALDVYARAATASADQQGMTIVQATGVVVVRTGAALASYYLLSALGGVPLG